MQMQSTTSPPTLDIGSNAGEKHLKIADLQILRGIAILMVFAQHLNITPTLLERLPIKVTMPFYVGVEIFFVISGYIITTILMRDGYSAPRFLAKRVFRLFPALFVFLALSGLVNTLFRTLPLPESAVRTYSVSADSFIRQAVSTLGGYYLLLGETSYSNGAMWSLSVEDQFYGAIAIVMAISAGVLRFRKTNVERMLGLLAAGVTLSILGIRLAILSRSVTTTSLPWIWAHLTVWRFDFIAAGVVLAFIDRRFRDSVRIKFAESGPMLCAYTLCGIVAVVAVCESPFLTHKHYLDGFALPLVCLGACFVTLLAANGVAFPKTRGAVARCLERIGDRSYTYYLLHFPIFAVVWLIAHYTMPWAFRGAKAYGVVQLIGTVLLLIPLAEFVYRRIELPAIKSGRKLVDRWFPILDRSESATTPAIAAISASVGDPDTLPFGIEPKPEATTKRFNRSKAG